MAFQNPLAVTIAVGGKLQASLPATVRAANMQLLALNRSVIRINESMTAMGRRAVTGVLGLAGITGIVEVMKEGLNLAKEEAGVRAALNNLIANQNKLRGIGVQQSREQVEMLERQAKALQEQTGIYSGVLLKGDAYLAQFKLTAQQIQAIQGPMSNLLTYQRMMGRSAEDMPAVYEAVGKAIMGQAKGLKSVGVELNEQQLRQLKLNAAMGNYAANAAMIAREIQRQHGGAARQFAGTLGGQAAIAMARIQSGMEKLGEALRPLIQVGQIIVSRFITPILEKFEGLNKIVTDHWKGWVKYIDTYIVPAFKKLVDQGWQKLIDAIKWFQQNTSWLLPLLKNIVIGFGAWVFVIQPLGGIIMSLLNPLNLVLAALTAIGLAIWQGTTNWRQFRVMLEGIKNWIFGTKLLDPENKGFGAMRAYKPGEVPRAWPVQQGWLMQMIKAFENWRKTVWMPAVEKWFAETRPVILNAVKDILGLVTQAIGDWFKERWRDYAGWRDKLFQDMRDSIQNFFTGAIPPPQRVPGGHVAPRVGGPPTGFTPSQQDIQGLHITHYGYRSDPFIDPESARGIGKYTQHLVPYTGQGVSSVALMDALAAKWGLKPRQQFTYAGHTFRYDDRVPRGYWKAGVWHPHRDLRMDVYDPFMLWSKQASAGRAATRHPTESAERVVINYNVGGVTIHGTGPDMEHRLAAYHRRHIDQMSRDLEEVVYRRNRANFDGAAAT
jgi:hypothetical protein